MSIARNPTNLGGAQRLSPMQALVTERVAEGLSSKQIARELHRSPTTINSHVEEAMIRLGASNRANLVARAYQAGILHLVLAFCSIVINVLMLDSDMVRPARARTTRTTQTTKGGGRRELDLFDEWGMVPLDFTQT